jgi:Zn-dependent protease
MEQIPTIVLQVLFFFILINLVLMVFNLFPIPPLDGSKVLFAFLPPQVAWRWRPILEQYGFILLLLVFFVPPGDSIGGKILIPIIDGLLDLLVGR